MLVEWFVEKGCFVSAAPVARVLIANRGEIAVRVIRACRELGLWPVAIYGDGDENAEHVLVADDAYRLPVGSGIQYLNIDGIVEIALRAGATIVHPGYGFLSENASFADAVRAAGLTLAGPSPESMRALGDKIAARKVAQQAGVPIVPGTEDPVGSLAEVERWVGEHGFPVAVKAAGGGGGRGFRVAHDASELEGAYTGSSGEAQRYFANPAVFLERYIERPRHVEVQIIADNHGNVVALGERDCSVQRRHQKLIEETPSPAVTAELRAELCEAAISLAKTVGYASAGTVEFLVTTDRRFYFLEMNTRIQVEHTITEMVTGIDLVKEQLRVALGAPLSFTQAEIAPLGHSIQCRINAEDPGRDFAPSPGVLAAYKEPGGIGVRVDSAMRQGSAVLPTYDSMIAKLIVWGRDRDEAVARMSRALGEFAIEGVATTIPFHQNVMRHDVFQHGDVTTAFLPEHPEVIPGPANVTPVAAEVAPATREVVVEVNGRRFTVSVQGGFGATAEPDAANGARRNGRVAKKKTTSSTVLESPIQGSVMRVGVEIGQTVEQGELITVIEAMKMENEIVAHRAGTVTAVHISAGKMVQVGAPIVEIV
ncbi:acetyl-CoA carboxylase biotin carboxylase subunit [soil metagenome]